MCISGHSGSNSINTYHANVRTGGARNTNANTMRNNVMTSDGNRSNTSKAVHISQPLMQQQVLCHFFTYYLYKNLIMAFKLII